MNVTEQYRHRRNTAVNRIAHVGTSLPNWRSAFNESKSAAWPSVLNTYSFFGKDQNKVVNQTNTGNLINFMSEKSWVFLLHFPFTDFYERFNFFVNFASHRLFVMFSLKFLSGKLARGCQKMYPFAHARRLTAVFTVGEHSAATNVSRALFSSLHVRGVVWGLALPEALIALCTPVSLQHLIFGDLNTSLTF